MRIPLSILLVLFIVALTSSEALAQNHASDNIKPEDFQVGQEYFELAAPRVLYGPDDGQVEVLSFYWYNCGACYYMDPAVSTWAENLPPKVRLVRLPFSSREPTTFHARLAFTLESLGLGPDIHTKVFDLFQKQKQPIYNDQELPELAKALNINEQELIKAFNSPEVKAKMKQLEKVLQIYNLAGVPAMVIDGRYRFDVGTTRGTKNYLELADILIDRQLEVRSQR